jgi:hypothetical protein
LEILARVWASGIWVFIGVVGALAFKFSAVVVELQMYKRIISSRRRKLHEEEGKERRRERGGKGRGKGKVPQISQRHRPYRLGNKVEWEVGR